MFLIIYTAIGSLTDPGTFFRQLEQHLLLVEPGADPTTVLNSAFSSDAEHVAQRRVLTDMAANGPTPVLALFTTLADRQNITVQEYISQCLQQFWGEDRRRRVPLFIDSFVPSSRKVVLFIHCLFCFCLIKSLVFCR